jgi:hypothetical protein
MTENAAVVLPKLNQEIEQTIHTGITALEQTTDLNELLPQLVDQGQALSTLITRCGDTHLALLKKPQASKVDQKRAVIITFDWAGPAKAFLLLWRDTIFELQKAGILLRIGQIETDSITALRAKAKTTLEEATKVLLGFTEQKLQKLHRQKNGIDRYLDRVQLQTNPWPVYREQLETIGKQMGGLLSSFRELGQIADHFATIQTDLQNTVESCRAEIEQQIASAQRITQSIEQEEDFRPARIAALLEEKEAEIQLVHHVNEYLERSERDISLLLEKQQVPVQVDGGLIQFKEIAFQRATRQWLDSEIVPLIYEIWELTELNANGMKMALLNMRNRALLLASEAKEGRSGEFDRRDLTQPLQTFIRRSAGTVEEITKLQRLINMRLSRDFNLKHLYSDQDNFLPVPLQSTINKLRVNQSAVVVSVRNWIQAQTRLFRNFQRTVELEESLSVSEKVVRYLQSRNWETTNTHYNSIFLTKGYIGESFWVGRQDELSHMEKLIRDWQSGFRGAVLLSGQRLSGKSLMGELIANRFFLQNTIRLQPQTVISVESRKMTTTYDLEEALSFIRKYTLNKPCLVWIDDLELWRDPAVPLGKNVTALRRYIDDYGNQLFFLISMGNSLRHHLDHFYDITKVFQAEINLDRMSQQEIREAIMIRHGATHKELFDAKGREMTPQQFQQATAKVYKAAHGNIGEALNIWAFSTEAINEDNVLHQMHTLYELPDFITPDNAILLSSIMLARKINEYRLRKLFGPVFSDKYRGVLQRLISVGLLRRNTDGWLEITESASNDLGRLLDKKKYLKYQK